MKQSIRSSLFAIAALGLLAPGPAQADAVADFYKGKTITGYPGGNDVLLAMERGNPEWVFYSIAIFYLFWYFFNHGQPAGFLPKGGYQRWRRNVSDATPSQRRGSAGCIVPAA
ncbi:MAG TPA: hypothetical protein EYM29_10585 [Rhodospirillales bacterium]|nr:hypothetical protein [Rhodospirillales bacterium]